MTSRREFGPLRTGTTTVEIAEAAPSRVLTFPGSRTDFTGIVIRGKSRMRSNSAPSSMFASVQGLLPKKPSLALAENMPDMSKEFNTGS